MYLEIFLLVGLLVGFILATVVIKDSDLSAFVFFFTILMLLVFIPMYSICCTTGAELKQYPVIDYSLAADTHDSYYAVSYYNENNELKMLRASDDSVRMTTEETHVSTCETHLFFIKSTKEVFFLNPSDFDTTDTDTDT